MFRTNMDMIGTKSICQKILSFLFQQLFYSSSRISCRVTLMSRRLVFVTCRLTFMSRRLVFVTHRVMFMSRRIVFVMRSFLKIKIEMIFILITLNLTWVVLWKYLVLCFAHTPYIYSSRNG